MCVCVCGFVCVYCTLGFVCVRVCGVYCALGWVVCAGVCTRVYVCACVSVVGYVCVVVGARVAVRVCVRVCMPVVYTWAYGVVVSTFVFFPRLSWFEYRPGGEISILLISTLKVTLALRWKACEKIAVFFDFVQNLKHTHSYAKFIVDSISENRFNISCL